MFSAWVPGYLFLSLVRIAPNFVVKVFFLALEVWDAQIVLLMKAKLYTDHYAACV